MSYSCHNAGRSHKLVMVQDLRNKHAVRFTHDCQYVRTAKGQADKNCLGCKWRADKTVLQFL